ncbi:hypothetical protein PGB90_010623 [Kerria lacca]
MIILSVNKSLRLIELCAVKQFTSYRNFSLTSVCEAHKQAGKYRTTRNRSRPLTYEMANLPTTIAHYKSWNSWNTSCMFEGVRPAETAVEDEFIRKFITGTWHNLFVSEIIIKRQYNIIRVAGIIYRGIQQRKMYFLIGYSEELLSYWLQCPVKLELQTVSSRKDVIFKYI